jgi:hypothetical protein
LRALTKDSMIQYLLGDLSESDRESLEKQFLADNDQWEALHAVENDLFDAYARGELSAERRQRFEENLLDSPEKYERLAIAGLLMNPATRQKVAATAPRRRRRAWPTSTSVKLAVGASALVAMATMMFLLKQTHDLKREIVQIKTQSSQPANDSPLATAAGQEVAVVRPKAAASPPQTSVAILLTAGVSRGSDTNSAELVIPATASVVVLELNLRRDRYRDYDVRLETVDGKVVRHLEGLRSEATANEGRIMTMRLGAELFSTGDYRILLSGRDDKGQLHVVDSYSLSVAR